MNYQDFIATKMSTVKPSGFDVQELPDFLFEYQKFVVKLALNKGKFAIFAGTGLGKALRNGTNVLTPGGWVAIESVKVGDMVYGSNGNPCSVIGVFPQGKRQLYKVTFSDGTTIDCDGDHLWTTKTRKHRAKKTNGRTLTTNQIVDDSLFDKDGGKRHFIDTVNPINFPQSNLILDPYLVGVLIGDGSLSDGSVGLTTDNEIIASLNLPEDITPKLESVLTKNVSTVRLSLNRGTNGKTYHSLLDPLNELGLRYCRSFEKFIPKDYLFGSVDQRRELLAGLLDTDGSTYDGTVEYCTSSPQLAKDVQFLVQSLGGTAPIGIKKTKYTYKDEQKTGLDAYRLNISLGHYCPFKLTRKREAWIPKPQRANVPRSIVNIEEIDVDYATCISIDSPDSLYVTEGFVLTHNTAMQLTWANEVHKYTKRPVLILAPLAVAKQTAFDEAKKFGIEVKYCTSQSDVSNGINITNYEKLEKFDCDTFVGIVLDESSILKGFNGKTRTQLIELFEYTPYKLACTATPSPNDYLELGNHCEFLNVMRRDEMLATFFVHDGKVSLTDEIWKLKKHGKIKFWEWLASWSVMFQKPSHLGFSDDNYQLPQLIEHELTIQSGIVREGELFTMEAKGLAEQRHAKRSTIDSRVRVAADLINASDEQWLVWCDLNDESAALAAAINASVEVKGSDKDSHKENSALDFAHGKIKVLISKPSIYGFGLNFQSCHNMLFVGLSNSFELTYQAVRRCYRFGQKQDVNVYYVSVDVEGAVLKNVQKKHRKFEEMQAKIAKHFLSSYKSESQSKDYNPTKTMTSSIIKVKDGLCLNQKHGKDYSLFQGDCVELIKATPDDSIGYSIFSPPFSSLFVYSNSFHDMGNVTSEDQFVEHYKFLLSELYRVMMPGRLVSVHCQDLISTKSHDGCIGIKDFSGLMIRLMQELGFIYHSRVTIWKDPVCQMQRLKPIGLLHKQVEKDSTLSRQAMPDYLVTFRKPGDNTEPVAGRFEEYYGEDALPKESDPKWHSINIWQRYASPVWMDIAQNDTLNFREAKEDDDGKHVCPLQLTVIRRALQLWSNPGDTVLSPFAGIGSEGYVSLDMGRKFIGFELKKSYFDCAAQNLEYIANKPQQLALIA